MATRRVEIERTLDIPLKEVSGICTYRRADGTALLAAVGDASSTLAWAKVSKAKGLGKWHHVDLADAAKDVLPARARRPRRWSPTPAACSCCSSKSLRRVLVFDIDARRLVVQIELSCRPTSQSRMPGPTTRTRGARA